MIDIPKNKFGLNIRFVDESDAEFILSLRTNVKLGRFITATTSDISSQKNWIHNYKQREKDGLEYYFLFSNSEGENIGVNRIYNLTNKSFEIGSWIFKESNNPSSSILADIYTRDFGFFKLGFNNSVFQVRKENKSVLRYHQLYQPTQIEEDDLNFYFELSISKYSENRQ
jgi:hypothetical protein